MLMAVFCLGASLIGINAQEKDWANLQRYAQQNAELPKPDKNEKRVVFMGNSITEGWVNTHPDFFKSNGYIGRGIGDAARDITGTGNGAYSGTPSWEPDSSAVRY